MEEIDVYNIMDWEEIIKILLQKFNPNHKKITCVLLH